VALLQAIYSAALCILGLVWTTTLLYVAPWLLWIVMTSAGTTGNCFRSMVVVWLELIWKLLTILTTGVHEGSLRWLHFYRTLTPMLSSKNSIQRIFGVLDVLKPISLRTPVAPLTRPSDVSTLTVIIYFAVVFKVSEVHKPCVSDFF